MGCEARRLATAPAPGHGEPSLGSGGKLCYDFAMMDHLNRDECERRYDGTLPEAVEAALEEGGSRRARLHAAWSNSRLLDRLARHETQAAAARRLGDPHPREYRGRLFAYRAAGLSWYNRGQD